MAEEKSAKRVYKLDDIKFNEENKTMAIVSWISIVGLIMFFVEKKDLFVRYIGAQIIVVNIAAILLSLIVMVIPLLRWLLAPMLPLATLVIIIIGMVKTSKGERFDIPLISEYALKLMSAV